MARISYALPAMIIELAMTKSSQISVDDPGRRIVAAGSG
jgi:hypothetical protein